MEIELFDEILNEYTDIKITKPMFEHAFEEMSQRFGFIEGGIDALHNYVNDHPTVIHCDHCDSPKESVVYTSYLVPKMISMSIIDSDDFTETEMCLWWLLWKNTKDIEIREIPTLKTMVDRKGE